VLIPVVLTLFATAPASGPTYEEARAAAVKNCAAIDASASQSGLYGNPDGYQSFYLRSQCLQQAALQFRDDALCARVKQRRSLLSSSWGYSAGRCRTLVAEAIAADRRTLADLRRDYTTGRVTLQDFRIERNGNGRDFDFIPTFDGGKGHGYTITVEIIPAEATGRPILLHSSGYYVDAASNLRIYMTRPDVEQRVPGFTASRPYTERATLAFDIPTGPPDARWSDAFIDSAFPLRDRAQSITRQVEFPAAALPRRPAR
jgi:hypothetical protein